MKSSRILGLAILVALLFSSCNSSPGEAAKRFQPYPEEIAMLALVNTARSEARTCGTQAFAATNPVTWVETILDTAWFHSVAMSQANNEEHVAPGTLERLQARGFEADSALENRKRTALPAVPEDAFNAWLADAEACANIMNPTVTNLGVGLERTAANSFWTMILATPKGTGPAPTPTLTVNPTTTTVTVGGAAVTFNATLAGATDTINWTLTGPGTLSASTGATTSYTPPGTGDAGTATLTATAGALTASASITINAAQAPTPSLTVTPNTATVTIGGAAVAFTANLQNATDPINWALTGAGTLSAATGTTTNYTPPATGDAGTANLTATAGALTASATITINAAPTPNAFTIEVKDLQRAVVTLPIVNGPSFLPLSERPMAPLAANPNGGGYILWTRQTDNKLMLTSLDAAGNPVGTDQDLGTGNAGTVSTDGTKIAYLIKTGKDQMAFKVIGGGETLVVDNGKPGVWVPPGQESEFKYFGNTAMLNPLDYRRVAILPVADKWFVSFDHNNNFGTPAAPDVHTGMSMLMLDSDGTSPSLVKAWGTSHSLDILALYDGTNILNITVGDSFPKDFRLHVFDNQGAEVRQVDLFGKNKFVVDGTTITEVPALGQGVSSGHIGGLSNVGGGKFVLSYLIQNNVFPGKLNEIGILNFDKEGTATRTKLKEGTDIKYIRSSRYGANILVAWETTAGKFFAMVVNPQGDTIVAETELAAGVLLNSRDSMVTMSNGDVMWTASDGGTLKVFRLPAP